MYRSRRSVARFAEQILSYSTKAGKNVSNSQYIINRVKTYDYENYLLLLLSPKQHRYPLFVLHSYNVELSLILESATDVSRSSGRFTFWHDAIDKIFSGKRPYDHPVVQELSKLHDYNLINTQQCKTSLLNMLNGRQGLASVTHLETMHLLETYAEHTKASLLYLTLGITGQSSVDADHAASHLGRCSGILTALRSTPYLASKNQLLLPQDILSLHGVSQSDVVRGKENVKEAVFDIATQANTHMEKYKALAAKLPKDTRKCFLPATICDIQLELLRRVDFNVFDSEFLKKNSMLPWKLWRASKKL